MSIEETVNEVVKSREHLDDTEERYFAGNAHLDELRLAYEQLQQAERRAAEEHHYQWNQ
jgi:hypothetical protein